jgi:hypothetical protein
MRRIVRRAVVAAFVLTTAAAIVLFASSGIRARVADAYLVAVAGVVMLMLIRWVGTLLPERSPSLLEAALTAMRAPAPVIGELSLERDVDLGRVNAFHFHTRVRPVLRGIASSRLRRRYGVDLDREPVRARELLPSSAWDVVRPDAPPPADRLARGPSIASLNAIVDELERV